MNEALKSIEQLLNRDLERLTKEVESYHDESNLWKLSGEISNTAGNLCLHICGNLKHFIGATLGNSGYVRKREAEFELKNISRVDLIKNIDETKDVISSTLENFDSNKLEAPYPIEVLQRPFSNVGFLIHLAGHLNYHLGQINYQRRLMDLTN